MLNISGSKKRGYCDGIDRRDMLKIGAMGFGFGSMTLADLNRLEAAAGIKNSTRSLINVHLGGGPSHQDMWDLKPDAPAEYRGEFTQIQTKVQGVDICEHFSELSSHADKFALVRPALRSARRRGSPVGSPDSRRSHA